MEPGSRSLGQYSSRHRSRLLSKKMRLAATEESPSIDQENLTDAKKTNDSRQSPLPTPTETFAQIQLYRDARPEHLNVEYNDLAGKTFACDSKTLDACDPNQRYTINESFEFIPSISSSGATKEDELNEYDEFEYRFSDSESDADPEECVADEVESSLNNDKEGLESQKIINKMNTDENPTFNASDMSRMCNLFSNALKVNLSIWTRVTGNCSDFDENPDAH
ncbi:hypothetical protein QAD02_013692 [Eretmocerus hayati]|uniref:Uncharacterized protein n=1 Tax=Eretmocerus hayati TaxID=131215 RepID=A0ACC2P2V7_9HYME|nr:hypothetical protein QAD02_013692 [Eretmocerus hayati]